jgi:hypothetical protein
MNTAVLDPVEAHVAELERSLPGPEKVRRSMVREVRDGLDDAVDAYLSSGLTPEHAARQAVRDFGPVSAVVPLYRDELAAGQGRRTALLLAIGLPGLMLGWDLVWSSGLVGESPAPMAVWLTVKDLARVQDLVGAVAAATALVLAALTFRRTASPRRVAAATAVTTLTAVALCVASAIAMNVVNFAQAWERLTVQPVGQLAYAGSVAVAVLLCRAALRTIRALRPPRPYRNAGARGRAQGRSARHS